MRFLAPMLMAALFVPCILGAEEQVPTTREQITMSFAPVVKRAMPAVVNIYTQHIEKVQVSPFMNDPLFQQFFAGGGFGNLPRERMVHSLGSGVIVGEDGLIVTSYHVVKGSDQITIVLSDKREFTGKVEKVDERSDLAVLRVDTKGAKLPVLRLRDSETLEVGDLVLAIGNPFGVGQTVTSGIISALARSAEGISDYQFFIQTDAAINPGNSGGALIDMQGNLIGINTAIYSHTGGYQGIGFAIPANMVKAILQEKALANGTVERPWLGLDVQPVTHDIAQAEGMDIPRGVLVNHIIAGSPAELAGIKEGDIITAINHNAVDDPQSFNFRIVTTGINNPVPFELLHGGKTRSVTVTLIAPPAVAPVKLILLKGDHPLDGVTVSPLTQEIAANLQVKSADPRVVVMKAAANPWGMSAAAGDIILSVNGNDIHTIEQLQKVLAIPRNTFEIKVVRQGMVITMTVSH